MSNHTKFILAHFLALILLSLLSYFFSHIFIFHLYHIFHHHLINDVLIYSKLHKRSFLFWMKNKITSLTMLLGIYSQIKSIVHFLHLVNLLFFVSLPRQLLLARFSVSATEKQNKRTFILFVSHL